MMPFFSKSLVGLDIQPTQLQLVQITKIRHGQLLQRAEKMALPAHIFMEGKISDWQMLQMILSEGVKKMGLQGKITALSLPSHLVRMQCMKIPKGLSAPQINAEIDSVIKREQQTANEEFCVDYTLASTKENEYDDLLFAYARERDLSRYVHCVNAAGLKVKMIDIDSFALKRALHFIWQSPHHTNAILLQNKQGGSLTIVNSQQILLHHYWNETDTKKMVEEVMQQLQIHSAIRQHELVQELAICAHAKKTAEIAQQLQNIIKIKIIYPNFIINIKFNGTFNQTHFAENIPDFLIAVGCAMRELPAWQN